MFAQIKKDIDSIMLRDPAAKTRLEAALCYPGLHAIWLHRIAHHPVAAGDGAAVNSQIVGGNAVFLPQLHGQNAVDDVAGSEKQNIVIPLVCQKGAIFIVAVVHPQGPGQKNQSPCQHCQQHQDADGLPEPFRTENR